LAVGYFLGATMYIVEVRILCAQYALDVPVFWTVFCWYETCIDQKLQLTCLLQQSDIVWRICASPSHRDIDGRFQAIKNDFFSSVFIP